MTDENNPAPKKDSDVRFADRRSRLSRLARKLLDGPRSVLLSSDPRGLRVWFEPIVRIAVRHWGQDVFESDGIYCIPNCIEHDSTSMILLRRAVWNRRDDVQRCRLEGITTPVVSVVYAVLPSAEIQTADAVLKELDRSLLALPIRVEGLDLDGASRFRPLPPDAKISVSTKSFKVARVSRFHSLEFGWQQSSGSTAIESSCGLWRDMASRIISGQSEPLANVIERYDHVDASKSEFEDVSIESTTTNASDSQAADSKQQNGEA